MGKILVKGALNALKIEVFKNNVFIEEIQFSGTYFVTDIFKAFKALLLKLCPFLSADFGVLLRDMNLT
jgi:hypothetical protein